MRMRGANRELLLLDYLANHCAQSFVCILTGIQTCKRSTGIPFDKTWGGIKLGRDDTFVQSIWVMPLLKSCWQGGAECFDNVFNF